MVSDIPAGDGKIANLFLQCMVHKYLLYEYGKKTRLYRWKMRASIPQNKELIETNMIVNFKEMHRFYYESQAFLSTNLWYSMSQKNLVHKSFSTYTV